jgi:hypothetical protein
MKFKNFQIASIAYSFFFGKIGKQIGLIIGQEFFRNDNFFVAAGITEYFSTTSTMMLSVNHGKCASTIFTMSDMCFVYHF